MSDGHRVWNRCRIRQRRVRLCLRRGVQGMNVIPSIYVASLTDYNCGRLHGVWIDLGAGVDSDDVMNQIVEMLADSPAVRFGEDWIAEEWAIHDHEGFEGYKVSEYHDLGEVMEAAEAIEQHGEPMALWLSLPDRSVADAITSFNDAFRGVWESPEDWANDEFREIYSEVVAVMDECGYLTFNADYYITEAQSNGGVQFERTANRCVAVFDTCSV
ncbi:antirestriction protein ArdA [Pseudonocardiaceae bacterium YIM PH 21723]|nr:antirestriction protein ArdA [Pseudonocardiaceae bacterium YIM PH 21723]